MVAFLIFILALPAMAAPAEFQFVLQAEDNPSVITRGARIERIKISEDMTLETMVLPTSLEERLQSIQKKYGEIACDCAMYVQIKAQLQAFRGGLRRVVLLPPANNPPAAIACACGKDLAYLRFRNASIHLNMQSTSYSGKGHWLLPQEDKTYSGLLNEGPVRGSLKKWQMWAREALEAEYEIRASCQDRISTSSKEWIETDYVRLLIASGESANWTLTKIPKNSFPRAQAKRLRDALKKFRIDND